MNVDYPQVLIKKGNGRFFNSHNSYTADFEITSYPDKNLITTAPQTNLDLKNIFDNEESWTLEGTVDDGKTVQSNDLFLNEFNGEFFRFFAAKEIHFGNKNIQIKCAKYPLVGFYKGSISLNNNDWLIETDKEYVHETDNFLRLSKIWKTQIETRALNLEHPDSMDKEDYLKKIIDITSLISLATGNQTTFHRQIYISPTNEEYEVWRKRVDYHFGIGSIIEPVRITHFLEQTLTNYENLDPAKSGAINRAVEYINSAAHGYIEDRIFRVSVAWELLSLEYCPFNKLDPELATLKKRLKKSIKEWNKEYPELNKDGLLNDRVSKSLEWEKLVMQMKKFAKSENLDVETIGINFHELKELRDNVAHTGKFKQKVDSMHIIKAMEKAIFGLRVIILKKLGYNGDIQKPIDNYLFRKDINEFLIY
jgi:hypothetical protein